MTDFQAENPQQPDNIQEEPVKQINENTTGQAEYPPFSYNNGHTIEQPNQDTVPNPSSMYPPYGQPAYQNGTMPSPPQEPYQNTVPPQYPQQPYTPYGQYGYPSNYGPYPEGYPSSYQNTNYYQGNPQQYGYPQNYYNTSTYNPYSYESQEVQEERKKLKKLANGQGLTLLAQLGLAYACIFLIEFIVIFAIILFSNGTMDFTSASRMISTSNLYLYGVTVLYLIISNVIPFAVFLKKRNYSPAKLFNVKSPEAKKHLRPWVLGLSVLVCMGLNGMGGLLSQLLHNILEAFGLSPAGSGLTMPQDSVPAMVLFIIATCVVAPITEEFAFRGALLTPLRKYGDAFAIIISSIIFSIAHGNLEQIPSTFLIGITLGYICVKSNSIVPSIILHFFNNAIAISTEIFKSEAYATGLGLFLILSMIIAFVTIIIMSAQRQKYAFQNAYETSNSRLIYNKASTYFFRAGAMCTMLVIFVITFIFSVAGSQLIKFLFGS